MADTPEDNPLQGLYLTRIYREEPFRVVTDLPKAEAVAICSKFASHRRVNDNPNDQAAYMEGRIETENWLRASAESAGIDIRKNHPVYFCLTTEPQEDKAPPGMKAISIPTEKFDLSCCSFTYGDSMGNHLAHLPEGTPQHPLQGAVLNAKQIGQAIKTFGLDLHNDYINGGRYIEAQVWADPREAAGLKTPTPTTSAMPAREFSSSSAL